MKQRPRTCYSASQRAIIWHRWRKGRDHSPLRVYLIDFIQTYSQSKLNSMARRLNERPRKTLDFNTPAQRFHQSVASTGSIRTSLLALPLRH